MIDQPTQAQAGDETARQMDYTSIGEYFNEQLGKARGSQAAFEAYQPTAKANAEAIGSFEGRAPGEAPVGIRAQGMTTAQAISSTASKTQGNILDILTNMMSLKKQQSADEQRVIDNKRAQDEYEADLAERGLKVVRDESTGEDTVVGMTDEEKAERQLDGLDEVTASYLQMFQDGNMKKISEIPAAERSQVVVALADRGIDLDQIAKEKEGGGVKGVLEQLYKNYEDPDLSRGRIGGTVTALGMLTGQSPKATKYSSLKGGTLSSIRSFIGEKGIMTEPDAQRIVDLLPKVSDTDEEAKGKWENINEIFRASYGVPAFEIKTSDNLSEEWVPEDAVSRYKKEFGIK